ncbi:hypothetical protein NDU88_004554 [Pleurodeles waltl]|uniref:Uncharacterized protein n=1 Tax=Pleurodeles waltl TaxID=8319 RepID=A0AAV7UH39_PLEWA|nr:hypothetical protein NDU88_004554 [Pleurodeles waltl]
MTAGPAPDAVRMNASRKRKRGRKTIEALVREAEHCHKVIRRIGELIGAWSPFGKVEMAPKNIRNAGDKRERARQTRTAKDGSEGGLAGIRSVLGATKLSSKVGGGTVKDVSSTSRVAQLDHNAKGRTQPDIINFLTIGR